MLQTKLTHGLYKIFWKSGGSSIAAVGGTHDGSNWYAPCNWTTESNKKPMVASTDWSEVEKVSLIISNNVNNIETMLLPTEEVTMSAILAAREVQEYIWKDVSLTKQNKDWESHKKVWMEIFQKRVDKIGEIDVTKANAKVELRKRILQQAALSIAALEIL